MQDKAKIIKNLTIVSIILSLVIIALLVVSYSVMSS